MFIFLLLFVGHRARQEESSDVITLLVLFPQTLVVFACFGFEKQLIIIPFLSR